MPTVAESNRAAEPASRAPGELASGATGTLMWVGDRHRAEFRDAYAYCEQHAAQLAPRRDLADALVRPAAAVDRIVIARPTRAEAAGEMEQQLAAQYPGASVVRLLGALCAGDSPSRLEPFGTSRIYWHQANQVLPKWFGAGLPAEVSADSPRRSVAVIAATAAAAEPLLDLAASAGATAVWCRRADRFRVRNVDLVWWDDSAAPAASVETWRQRLATVSAAATGLRLRDEVRYPEPEAPAHRVRHAWLAGGPTLRQCRQAAEAGVQIILTKPAQIEPLLSTISCSEAECRGESAPSPAAPAVAEQRVIQAA